MKNLNNSWRNFLNESSQANSVLFEDTRIRIKLENKQNLLREVTEDELEHIQMAIDELKFDDLAFQEIFGDRSRIVINFPTLDHKSELGQFVNLLQHKFGLDIDWDKGMVSVERQWTDNRNTSEDMLNMVFGREAKPKMKKKLQMKIGRYLAKIDDLVIQLKELKEKVVAAVRSKHAARNPGHGRYPLNRGIPAWHQRVTIGEMDEALTKEETQRYEQIQNQLELLTGFSTVTQFRAWFMEEAEKVKWEEDEQQRRDEQDSGDVAHDRKPRKRQPIVVPETKFVDLGKYWLNNAKYIKENISQLDEDQYSIIITRDPIDVWRMSDFDNISSCHSPPSRGGGGEYYKCAVAEAHGHGALAYVVETEELLYGTDTDNIESAEQEINSMGEIFVDHERRAASDIDLAPVSRLRIRKLRYYDGDFLAQETSDAGTQIASAERRLYGAQIPGFHERLINWLQKEQGEQMEKAPRLDGGTILNLDHFVQFGGSQYDTSMSAQLQDLFGVAITGTKGQVRQNSETEDELDADLLLGGLLQEYQQSCDEITERFNTKYGWTSVEGTAVDDGGGGVYITCEATTNVDWDSDEFTKMPGLELIAEALAELEPWGMNWPDSKYPFIFKKLSNGQWRLPITVIPERLVAFNDQEYAYDPDSYEEFCWAVDDEVDNKQDALKEMLTTQFKRAGYMDGGAVIALGHDVMNGEVGLYYWEAEAEEGDEPDGCEFVQFTAHPEVWYKDLGATEEQAMQIMNDRNFWLEIRRRLAAPAFENTGGLMYPQMPLDMDMLGTNGTEGESQELNLYFSVHGEDPDEQVNVLRNLVEIWDDQEELDRVVSEVFQAMFSSAIQGDENPVGSLPGDSSVSESSLREELNALKIERMLTRLNEVVTPQTSDDESADTDVDEYLQNNNIDRNDVEITEETLDAAGGDSELIDSYAEQAESMGAVKQAVIDELCKTGIRKPVVIAKGIADKIVGGRHRFIAAKKCNIALPVVYISRKAP
mgnify:FL=1